MNVEQPPAAGSRATFPARCDVLVIGAGPAGLAIGACLRRRGLEPVILERGPAVGWSWHGHYERLHLHTVKEHSALPFRPFPPDVPRYASRREVVAYLEDYARAFDLVPRLGEEARRVWREPDGWHVETAAGHYLASDVVIATGYNREPVVPHWPGEERFRGAITHSAAYRSPEPYRGRRVLVVGMGNTGAEIALDLADHGTRPAISARNPVVVIPRDFRGRSTQVSGLWLLRLRVPMAIRDRLGKAMSRRAFGDLEPWGLRRARFGPVALIERSGRLPVVDIGTIAAIREGRIAVLPGIARFTPDRIVSSDGGAHAFDAVILATGYRPGLDAFLEDADAALDARGHPAQPTGVIPGLHFVGFTRPRAGMLREIALTAPRVAAAIAQSRNSH